MEPYNRFKTTEPNRFMMSFASKSKAALKGDFSDDSYFANVKLRIQDLAHAVRRRVVIAIAPGRDVKLGFVYCWLVVGPEFVQKILQHI